MMDSMIPHYRAIAELSHRMLHEARKDRWEQVMVLSQQYSVAIERLRQHKMLSHTDRNARRDLLTRILDNDAHLRTLAAPELDRLSRQLGQLGKGQRMLKAYRRHSSPS